MTLYGAYIGGDAASANAVDAWLGEPFDGFLAYTEGWDPNNWEGLRPIVVTQRAGALGATRKRMLWSIMMMTDDAGVPGYQSIARGERYALHQQIGRDLITYHDGIGDTGPIYIRSTWEVPGEWFGWNVAATQDPTAFKGAWVQFSNALHSISPRIKTVWDFNSDRGAVEYLYPGDDVIDVISQDIYWIPDLQGTDAAAAFNRSRNGYSRGLQWHFDWCKGKSKPMAISEFGLKLNGPGYESLDHTSWMNAFLGFVDEVNADSRVGMAYVTWWDSEEANVGKFSVRGTAANQANVKALFRARLPGTIVGGAGSGPPPDPAFPPATLSAGTGSDTLVLRISQDYYQASCAYIVRVDGTQIGGSFTASALHSAAQSDTLTIRGEWGAGTHTVTVVLTNDLYGGSPDTDRNLYVDSATYNGVALTGLPVAVMGADPPGSFQFSETVPVPPPTPPPALQAPVLISHIGGRPMIAGSYGGGAPIRAVAGGAAAPPVIQPPAGQEWNPAGLRPGVPLNNDQFEYFGTDRDWADNFNHPTEGFSGIRWQPTWKRADGYYGAWEPAEAEIYRIQRKGASGQDAQTLVLTCGPNPAAVPVGESVVIWQLPGWNGGVVRNSSMALNGYNLPLRQKMTVTASTGSATYDANGRRIIEVAAGTDLPAIDHFVGSKPDQGQDMRCRHWAFYKNTALKELRHPLGWFKYNTIELMLPVNAYCLLGGLQGQPTWYDWTADYRNFGASLVEELWRMECQGLADHFGDTDPRYLAVELENEPTQSWATEPDGVGYGVLLPDVWYGMARQIWGAARTLVVKATRFGSLDSLRDEFNFTCPSGHNAHLVAHNYDGQAHMQGLSGGEVLYWSNIGQTDFYADTVAAKITQFGFKGGGMTEHGSYPFEWWDYNAKVDDAERGRRYGRMLTSLSRKGLYDFVWGATGDAINSVGVYTIDGKRIEAFHPGLRPFCRRANLTTT